MDAVKFNYGMYCGCKSTFSRKVDLTVITSLFKASESWSFGAPLCRFYGLFLCERAL